MDIVQEFKDHLIADGKSLPTVASYVGDVTAFLSFLQDKGTDPDGSLKRLYITSYRKHLIESGYEVNTVNKKINSLLSFNRFLVSTGKMAEIVVDAKRDRVRVAAGSEKEVKTFTEAETERILFHIQDPKKVSARDRLIVTLLLYTGVRVSELVAIRLRDLDLLAMTLKVVWGKGGKRREVPLKGEVVDAIREYMEVERKQNRYAESPHLLLTQRAPRMDRDAVNKVLKRLDKELGMEMHPHKFRRTFCTRLLATGKVPLTTVAALAGHAGVQTTATYYISTSRQDKEKAVSLL